MVIEVKILKLIVVDSILEVNKYKIVLPKKLLVKLVLIVISLK